MIILPQTNHKKINNIDSCTSTFLRFVTVYVTMFPQEDPSLMKYMEIVPDLACRCPNNFLAYDQQFRMLRQTVALPWDRIHILRNVQKARSSN